MFDLFVIVIIDAIGSVSMLFSFLEMLHFIIALGTSLFADMKSNTSQRARSDVRREYGTLLSSTQQSSFCEKVLRKMPRKTDRMLATNLFEPIPLIEAFVVFFI